MKSVGQRRKTDCRTASQRVKTALEYLSHQTQLTARPSSVYCVVSYGHIPVRQAIDSNFVNAYLDIYLFILHDTEMHNIRRRLKDSQHNIKLTMKERIKNKN